MLVDPFRVELLTTHRTHWTHRTCKMCTSGKSSAGHVIGLDLESPNEMVRGLLPAQGWNCI
jgi:hypothetical protein